QDTALFHKLFIRLEVSSQGKRSSCTPVQHGGGEEGKDLGEGGGLAWSTICTIPNGKEKIKEAIKSVPGTDAIIMRNRTGLISKTEQLLVLWTDDQIPKRSPISLHLIQGKAWRVFERLKRAVGEGYNENFGASRDRWEMEESSQDAAAPLPKDKKEEKMYGKQSSEQNQLTGELENCSGLPCPDTNVLLDTDDCPEKEVCSRCGKTLCDESGLCWAHLAKRLEQER
ncbi:putative Tigger transposable element derived 6-like protein, partial [Naja naja]